MKNQKHVNHDYVIFSFGALFEGSKNIPALWAVELMKKLQFHYHIVVVSFHKECCREDMIGVLRDLLGRSGGMPVLLLEDNNDKSDLRFWLLNRIRACITLFKQNPEFVIVENCFMDSKLGDVKISSAATREIGMLPYMGALREFRILQVFNKI